VTSSETNPYAPPKAAVDDVEPSAPLALPRFFPVSRKKLIVMSTMTLTLYQLVWFYMNWRLVQRGGGNVAPLLRTIFAVFFCYPLFTRIRRYRADLSSAALPAGALALGYILVTLMSGIVERFSTDAGTYLLSVALGYASVLCLLPAQTAVDTINRAEVPDHDPNDRFTIWNWLWMIVGGFLTVGAFAGF
jgi:hypothetical protein